MEFKFTETVCGIWEVEGNETISECISQSWFKDANLLLEIKPWMVQLSVVDYDALGYNRVVIQTTNTQKLSDKQGLLKDAMWRALCKPQKAQKSTWEVPHELYEMHKSKILLIHANTLLYNWWYLLRPNWQAAGVIRVKAIFSLFRHFGF